MDYKIRVVGYLVLWGNTTECTDIRLGEGLILIGYPRFVDLRRSIESQTTILAGAIKLRPLC
jgi:hypothetical protein